MNPAIHQAAALIKVQADVLALAKTLATIVQRLQKAGLDLPDSDALFRSLQAEELQRGLIAFEDASPGIAAQLQQLMDETKRQIPPNPPVA